MPSPLDIFMLVVTGLAPVGVWWVGWKCQEEGPTMSAVTKQRDASEHKCFIEANKALEKDDTEVDFAFVITANKYYPILKTIRTDTGKKKPKVVFITYCPFCGEKL